MLVQVEIEEHMGDLPSTVESQKLEIDAIQSENDQKQERIIQIDKDIRHNESEIEDFSTKLKKYKEQGFDILSGLEALARYRGNQIGVKYAEAFDILKMVDNL